MTKYTIVISDEQENVSVTLNTPNPILIDYSQVQQQETGGGTDQTIRRIITFTNADLDSQGNITFLHNLDATLVDFSIVMPDVGEVEPDSSSYAYNQLTIGLSSYLPIVGNWTILIGIS